jgi:hypothetical protein
MPFTVRLEHWRGERHSAQGSEFAILGTLLKSWIRIEM